MATPPHRWCPECSSWRVVRGTSGRPRMGQERASPAWPWEVGVSDGVPLVLNGADDVRLLRAALRSLHDVVVLDRHPWAASSAGGTASGGRQLRALLLESLAAMEPPPGSRDHKGSVRHQLLMQRYVEGREVPDVAASLHVSRREYNRRHKDAVEALLSVLPGRLDVSG